MKRSAVVVAHAQAAAVRADVVADRVQEVGLAEAGRAVEEERVVGLAGQLGDRERGGVGEAVGVADDELVEGELRVELGRSSALAARRGGVARAGAAIGASGATTSTVVSGPSTAAAHVCSTRAKRSATQLRISSGAATTSVSSTTRARAQRREPDLEGRVRHGAAQLGSDRGPSRGRAAGSRQASSTPLGGGACETARGPRGSPGGGEYTSAPGRAWPAAGAAQSPHVAGKTSQRGGRTRRALGSRRRATRRPEP